LEYDITRDDRVSNQDTLMPRWWTNKIAKGKGKANAKGKGKGKGAKLPKEKAPEWLEAYSQIPPFGSSESKYCCLT
jgi:hypothetical protein